MRRGPPDDHEFLYSGDTDLPFEADREEEMKSSDAQVFRHL